MQTFSDRPDLREALQALDAEELHAFAGLLSPRESVVLHGRLRPPPRRWSHLVEPWVFHGNGYAR